MPIIGLLVVFAGFAAAEILVIIEIANLIGVTFTLLALILSSVLGVVLIRYEGRAAFLRAHKTLQTGRVPGREVINGALILVGGALLIIPGFISDFFGLILLIPPTRALVRMLIRRRVVLRWFKTTNNQPSADIEGSAVEIEPEQLPPRKPGQN